MKKSVSKQLDSAVVNLYDNLTRAKGKKGEEYVKRKTEGLALLKEAEKCYQLMHLLHDKADTQRKDIYSCVPNSNLYSETASKMADLVNNELGGLSQQYYNVIEKTLPNLLISDSQKSNIQKSCMDTCKVKKDNIFSTLTKTLQHELTMLIGKCMIQAETKITTLIVESMVTRLNDLTKEVEQLNTSGNKTATFTEIPSSKQVEQLNTSGNKTATFTEIPTSKQENQQDADIDESIKQRRFTYTEKRKDHVVVPRTLSASSITKVKPQIPAKPKKRMSIDSATSSEHSTASEKAPLFSTKKPEVVSDGNLQYTETSSVKSEEPVDLVPETGVIPTEAKPAEPVPDEQPTPDKEQPEEKDEMIVVEKTEKPAEVEKTDAAVKEFEVEVVEETKEESPSAVELVPDETDGKQITEEKEQVTEEKEDLEEKPAEVKQEGEKEGENGKTELPEALTNGVGMSESAIDFDVIEDRPALTSITKTRVKGPKKKSRPTKSIAISTLDPYEAAAASATNEEGTNGDARPEVEIAPKPEKKKLYQRGPPIPGMGNMSGMGGMNNELMAKLGRRNKNTEESHESEPTDAATTPGPESSETSPKKKAFRPPGGFAMPGMGMGMGMGDELSKKLKSRQKTGENDEASDKSDKAEKSDKGGPMVPPKPKSKPKGGIGLFSRPRSPGSVGANKSPELTKSGDSRSKSFGGNS